LKIAKTADLALLNRLEPDETAELRDLYVHEIQPQRGILLAGDHACGEYLADDEQTRHVLGYINLPPTKFSSVAATCRIRFTYQPGGPSPRYESCLFHMSSEGCWQTHFTLGHVGRGEIRFEICPTAFGMWEDRAHIQTTTTFSCRAQPYEVTAILREDGSQALFVDGKLEAQGPGVRGKTDQWDTCRTRNYIGRWMRPDQSVPLNAGFLSLELYDGDVSAADASAEKRVECALEEKGATIP